MTNEMTNKEAIEILKEICDYRDWLPLDCEDEECLTAIVKAIEALEKQEPKKGIPYISAKNHKFIECPSCHKKMLLYYRHCPDCGQAMNWRDVVL